MILHPVCENLFKTNIYVDSSFAGGWGDELPTNPDSVKSRTGYIVEIANCPILWVSTMQKTIATNTMKAEYTALSMALRVAIPLLDLIKEVVKGLNFCNERVLTFKATVHEDNCGALTLAQLEPGRHTPRSKFYALKLHWFRSWLSPRNINIEYVESAQQKSDFLTKWMPPVLFRQNCKLSMGW